MVCQQSSGTLSHLRLHSPAQQVVLRVLCSATADSCEMVEDSTCHIIFRKAGISKILVVPCVMSGRAPLAADQNGRSQGQQVKHKPQLGICIYSETTLALQVRCSVE